MSALKATVEIRGSADGEVLKLTKPISFWGGVNAKTGRISDPRHPQHDVSVTGKILADLITRGQTDLPIAPCDPARFA